MSYIRSEVLAVTASTGADTTTFQSAGTYNGFLEAVQYVPSTSAPPSTGGSLAITGERTGLAILSINDLSTASQNAYFPRFATVNSTAGTSTGSARPPLFDERIQVVVTSGSTSGAKAANLRFFVE